MNASELIARLHLQAHPLEGGYFRRSYQSPLAYVDPNDPQFQRPCASSILYLLTPDQPIGFMHRNKSDIVHCFHAGDPLEYVLIDNYGQMRRVILGNDIESGHEPQLIVPGGVWKGSRLCGEQFGLISEVVVPGFDYADNELATRSELLKRCPSLYSSIEHFIKPV